MPDVRCPLCKQPLPESISPSDLQSRIHRLAEPALAAEKQRLQKEMRDRLDEARSLERKKCEAELEARLQAEKDRAKREAQNEAAAEIKAANRRAAQAEADANKAGRQREREYSQKLRLEMEKVLAKAEDKHEADLARERKDREKEKVRYEAENARLRTEVNAISRKLERQSGERLGEESELDLFAELTRAFPQDDIKRVGRGTKGADIVHRVMDGTNEAGKIIYESKNVQDWHNSFIAQAGKYSAQYETPYVMIVTRAFPRKERDFCIVQKIPVVRPRMAVALARVMRDGVLAIGRLRLSGAGRDQKALELLDYLVSDRFITRFKSINDGVDALREQQQKEKNWHENAWESRSALHDKIDKSRREIDAQLQTILTTKKPIAFAARA